MQSIKIDAEMEEDDHISGCLFTKNQKITNCY